MKTLSTNPECEIINQREIPASPQEILAAFEDPAVLARWWGPAGFSNTIQSFDFHPGGEWKYVMHGPDGTDYPNEMKFVETGPEAVVMDHPGPVHEFRLAISLEKSGEKTRLIWRMTFKTAEECEKTRPYAPRCNEENLDRLEAALLTMRTAP